METLEAERRGLCCWKAMVWRQIRTMAAAGQVLTLGSETLVESP